MGNRDPLMQARAQEAHHFSLRPGTARNKRCGRSVAEHTPQAYVVWKEKGSINPLQRRAIDNNGMEPEEGVNALRTQRTTRLQVDPWQRPDRVLRLSHFPSRCGTVARAVVRSDVRCATASSHLRPRVR